MTCSIGYKGYEVEVVPGGTGTFLRFQVLGNQAHTFQVDWRRCLPDETSFLTQPGPGEVGWLYISALVFDSTRCVDGEGTLLNRMGRYRSMAALGYRAFYAYVVRRDGNEITFDVPGEAANVVVADWTDPCQAWSYHPYALRDPQVDDQGWVLFGPDHPAELEGWDYGQKWPDGLAGVPSTPVKVRIGAPHKGRSLGTIFVAGKAVRTNDNKVEYPVPIGHGRYFVVDPARNFCKATALPLHKAQDIAKIGITRHAIEALDLEVTLSFAEWMALAELTKTQFDALVPGVLNPPDRPPPKPDDSEP